MNLSVAVTENWGIGKNNDLLYKISADLQRFKQNTLGKTVIMGNGTFKSLPGKKPLPGRKNIIMSRDQDLEIEGATVINSFEALKTYLKNTPRDEIWVVGGEGIYRALLEECDYLYVTKIHAIADADAFFPNLDQDGMFEIVASSGIQKENGLEYEYVTYKNTQL